MVEELKTVREWCISCVFDEVIMNGKKYFKVRKDKATPSRIECLQCLYEKVVDVEITKPKNWRK